MFRCSAREALGQSLNRFIPNRFRAAHREHIRACGETNVTQMIKQALSFARGVEGEDIPLQPTHLIKEIIKILADTLPKNIEITFSISPELWNVSGDATQLRQVLTPRLKRIANALPRLYNPARLFRRSIEFKTN
jgi:hypothetical protein